MNFVDSIQRIPFGFIKPRPRCFLQEKWDFLAIQSLFSLRSFDIWMGFSELFVEIQTMKAFSCLLKISSCHDIFITADLAVFMADVLISLILLFSHNQLIKPNFWLSSSGVKGIPILDDLFLEVIVRIHIFVPSMEHCERTEFLSACNSIEPLNKLRLRLWNKQRSLFGSLNSLPQQFWVSSRIALSLKGNSKLGETLSFFH